MNYGFQLSHGTVVTIHTKSTHELLGTTHYFACSSQLPLLTHFIALIFSPYRSVIRPEAHGKEIHAYEFHTFSTHSAGLVLPYLRYWPLRLDRRLSILRVGVNWKQEMKSHQNLQSLRGSLRGSLRRSWRRSWRRSSLIRLWVNQCWRWTKSKVFCLIFHHVFPWHHQRREWQ